MKNKVILASASERRSDILNMLGIDFTVDPANIDETKVICKNPEDLVLRLSYEKANYIAKNYKSGFIIGADTVVYHNDQIIFKPNDFDDALRTLKELNGEINQVYTGISIINAATGVSYSDYDLSEVTFKSNKINRLKNFIELDKPYDKSGSYSISGIGSLMISEIKGDFYSVLGLSIRKLDELFLKHGIELL